MSKQYSRGNPSRRAFLTKASLILGAAAIAPWNKRMVWDIIQKSMIPMAEANDANTVDFVLELAIPASFPYGDLFPAPYFLRDDVDPDRGCSWERNEMRAVSAGNGRSLVLTKAAYALEPFAENICVFDSADYYINGHPGCWATRMAGWDQRAGIPDADYGGAALSVLFADAVAMRRGANAPATRGWVKEQGAIYLNKGSPETRVLPGFEQMLSGVDQLKEKFSQRPRTESNSELRRIVDTIREINAYQADRALRMRITNADAARSAADQGLSLITTDRLIDIADEYNTLANEFFANPGQDDIPTPRGSVQHGPEEAGAEDRHLGEALLKSFLGFKHNLAGATSIHIGLGHPHFSIVKLGDPAMRHASEYVGERLAKFLARCKTTDHPFRPGKKLFDHVLIHCSTDSARDISFRTDSGTNIQGYHWGESDKQGAVLIGGKVKGGYLGDTPLPRGQIFGTVEGFDPNSGALVPGNRFTGGSVYKTLALACEIPEADVRAQMGVHFDNGLIPTLFKS